MDTYVVTAPNALYVRERTIGLNLGADTADMVMSAMARDEREWLDIHTDLSDPRTVMFRLWRVSDAGTYHFLSEEEYLV